MRLRIREGLADLSRWARANPGPTLTISTFLLLTFAVLATAYRGEQTRETVVSVQRVFTRSACQVEPEGELCAQIRREIARSEPLRNPCISFRRIVRPPSVYRRFTRCATLDRKREESDDTETGTAARNGAAGGSSTAPAPGGGSGGDGDDGGADGSTPSPPGPDPSPPGDGGSPPGPDPEPPAPSPQPPASSPPTLGDQVGGAVDESHRARLRDHERARDLHPVKATVQKDQRRAREARKMVIAVTTPELRGIADEAADALKRLEDESAALLRQGIAPSR